jgi:hypothetical protein
MKLLLGQYLITRQVTIVQRDNVLYSSVQRLILAKESHWHICSPVLRFVVSTLLFATLFASLPVCLLFCGYKYPVPQR